MVKANWYGKTLINAFGGETESESKKIDYLTDTIKVMLCTSSYTPDLDVDEVKSDVDNEVSSSGTNYTAGGVALTNKTLTYNASTNTTKFDADDVEWVDSTITARYAVIYCDAGATDGDKLLLGLIDFEADKSSSNGSFKIQWHTDGVLKGTAL